MCVTLAICTKLKIFIVGNPIICLLLNLQFILDTCKQQFHDFDKQFLKPNVYTARASTVCMCKCVLFDYWLFTVCSLVSDQVLLHVIAIADETQYFS